MGTLLYVRDLRLDHASVPVIDGLSFTSEGPRVVVLGAPRALFDAMSGVVRPARGVVRIDGQEACGALAENLLAAAPLDPPLPPKWTARTYAMWSARLAGHAKRDAAERADAALATLQMARVADVVLARAPLHVRRAAVVAAALATGATRIVLEDPTSSQGRLAQGLVLPDEVARTLAEIVLAALGDRAWIVFAARAPLDSPLTLAATDTIVLHGSAVAAQGAPKALAAGTSTYALRVTGRTKEFAALVRARGADVVTTAEGMHVTVRLAGDCKSTRDLFEAAELAQAVLVELRPIARAFA